MMNRIRSIHRLFGTLATTAYFNIFPYRNTRPMIRFIKNNCSCYQGLVGCEIGVQHGVNAYSMLIELPIKKLYLIDPYEDYIEERKIMTQPASDFTFAQKMLKTFFNEICFIKKYSQKAVSTIPNDLDFVYIDGNHDYEFVKKDIELYYPKVKKGVIGG